MFNLLEAWCFHKLERAAMYLVLRMLFVPNDSKEEPQLKILPSSGPLVAQTLMGVNLLVTNLATLLPSVSNSCSLNFVQLTGDAR